MFFLLTDNIYAFTVVAGVIAFHTLYALWLGARLDALDATA